jgi:pseudo-rSAM protein
MSMKKSYWFYLESLVYISIKKDIAVLYNTLNGKMIESKNPVIINLIKKLNSKKNLFVVKLKEEDLINPDILMFVQEIRNGFFGDLIDSTYSKGKPIQMPPHLKIQNDLTLMRQLGELAEPEGIMEYLTEISFYVNQQCRQNCSICKGAYKQFLFCTKNPKARELKAEKIHQLLKESEGSSLFRINILGGHCFHYSKFDQLVNLLESLPVFKTFYLNYQNITSEEKGQLNILKKELFNLQILINPPIDELKLEQALKLLRESGVDHECTFVIEKAEEMGKIETISSRLNITDYSIKPFYNSNNFDFFKNHVFVNKEELLETKQSLKDIFSRQKVSPLFFGKITVSANGDIYANINKKPIGVLGQDSLYDVVLKEFYEGRSWNSPRKKVKPCKDCVYNFLCPPLTNYEFSMKKNNLCTITGD